jgi:hypothetical protein
MAALSSAFLALLRAWALLRISAIAIPQDQGLATIPLFSSTVARDVANGKQWGAYETGGIPTSQRTRDTPEKLLRLKS